MFHGLWGVATNGNAREAHQLLIGRIPGSWDAFLTTFPPSFRNLAEGKARSFLADTEKNALRWTAGRQAEEKQWGGLPHRCRIQAGVA